MAADAIEEKLDEFLRVCQIEKRYLLTYRSTFIKITYI